MAYTQFLYKDNINEKKITGFHYITVNSNGAYC